MSFIRLVPVEHNGTYSSAHYACFPLEDVIVNSNRIKSLRVMEEKYRSMFRGIDDLDPDAFYATASVEQGTFPPGSMLGAPPDAVYATRSCSNFIHWWLTKEEFDKAMGCLR